MLPTLRLLSTKGKREALEKRLALLTAKEEKTAVAVQKATESAAALGERDVEFLTLQESMALDEKTRAIKERVAKAMEMAQASTAKQCLMLLGGQQQHNHPPLNLLPMR